MKKNGLRQEKFRASFALYRVSLSLHSANLPLCSARFALELMRVPLVLPI